MYNNDFNPQNFAQRQMEAYFQDCREMEKAIAKAKVLEDIRSNALVNRMYLRQAEAERKKATFDELIITSDGEVQVVTRNLAIDAKPRMITNMQNPHIIILKRLKDMTEEILLLQCFVNNSLKKIFLNPKKAGKGEYLLRSFTLAGICFKSPSTNAKDLAMQLLALLLSSQPEERILPDEEGYVDLPGIGLAYIGDEDLTWKKATKLCK